LICTCRKGNAGIRDSQVWSSQAHDDLLLLPMAWICKELSSVGIAGSADAVDHDEL